MFILLSFLVFGAFVIFFGHLKLGFKVILKAFVVFYRVKWSVPNICQPL